MGCTWPLGSVSNVCLNIVQRFDISTFSEQLREVICKDKERVLSNSFPVSFVVNIAREKFF